MRPHRTLLTQASRRSLRWRIAIPVSPRPLVRAAHMWLSKRAGPSIATGAMLTGSDITARAIHAQGPNLLVGTCQADGFTGVRFAFGIVGVPVTPLAVALQKLGVAFVSFRNEQAASYATSIASYLTPGTPSVCITVAGPGMIHALAGVANAQANCWPLLLLSAGPETHLSGKGAFQETPQLPGIAPYVKYGARAETMDRIPFHIERALRVAKSGRPGAAYVEIPVRARVMDIASLTLTQADFFTSEIPAPVITPAAPIARSMPAEDDLIKAWDLIKAAERPLIVIGKGAAYARAEAELREMVDVTGLPFLSSPMGKGVVPDDHPLNVGAARSLALSKADVILLIGTRLNWMFNYGNSPTFALGVQFIQLDVAAEDLNSNTKAAVALSGDLQLALRHWNNTPRFRWQLKKTVWVDELQAKATANRTSLTKQCSDESVPMNYHFVLRTIAQALPRDCIVVNEGANTMDFGRLIIPNYEPRTRLDAGTLSTMGVGMGYAIAAALTRPTQRSVLVQGDSAFGFSGMEFETACRYKLPITVFLINNNGIYAGEEQLSGSDPLTITATSLLPQARYEKLAEAFGAKGYFVSTPDELRAAVKAAMETREPSIVNIMIRTDGPIPKIVAKKH